MNLFTKQRLADIENKLIATKVQMGAGGAKTEGRVEESRRVVSRPTSTVSYTGYSRAAVQQEP